MPKRINKILSLWEALFAWPAPAVFGLVIVAVFVSLVVHAEDASQDRLQTCLKKAVDMPDIANAEADAWVRQKGGMPALLCRATAQFHRGEFARSADDFAQLALGEKDPRQAAFLYQQAGVAFTRAENFKKAEEEYNAAIKLEQQDPEIWVSRATERAAAEKYWDAIGDLNHALDIMPDMLEALRLRGQIWFKLGMDGKAEDDFRHVAEIQAVDDVMKTKTPVQPVKE